MMTIFTSQQRLLLFILAFSQFVSGLMVDLYRCQVSSIPSILVEIGSGSGDFNLTTVVVERDRIPDDFLPVALSSTTKFPLKGDMLMLTEHPTNTTVKLHGSATMSCKFTGSAAEAIWFHGTRMLGMVPLKKGATVTTWTIKNATLEDDGNYSCQILPPEQDLALAGSSVLSRKAHLTVLVPSGRPTIVLHNGNEPLNEGATLRATCSAEDGNPRPTFEWRLGGSSKRSAVVSYRQGNKTTPLLSTSTLTYHVKSTDHNKLLTCTIVQPEVTSKAPARPTARPPPRTKMTRDNTANVTLTVRFAPKVSMSGLFRPLKANHSSFKIGCRSRANPAKVDWTWLVNNRPIRLGEGPWSVHNTPDAGASELRWNSLVGINLNGTNVTCIANNTATTTGLANGIISVKYGPLVQQRLSYHGVDMGSSKILTCPIVGNPPLAYSWHRLDSPQRVLSTDRNLHLSSVGPSELGTYICSGTVRNAGTQSSRTGAGQQREDAQLHLVVNGPPKLTALQRNVNALLNYDAVLECNVHSVVDLIGVEWFHNDVRVLTNSKYLIAESRVDDWNTRVSLRIYGLTTAELGTYNCSASNRFGASSLSLELAQSRSTNLALLLGICGGVLFALLLLAAAVAVCHRTHWRVCRKCCSRGKTDSVSSASTELKAGSLSDECFASGTVFRTKAAAGSAAGVGKSQASPLGETADSGCGCSSDGSESKMPVPGSADDHRSNSRTAYSNHGVPSAVPGSSHLPATATTAPVAHLGPATSNYVDPSHIHWMPYSQEVSTLNPAKQFYGTPAYSNTARMDEATLPTNIYTLPSAHELYSPMPPATQQPHAVQMPTSASLYTDLVPVRDVPISAATASPYNSRSELLPYQQLQHQAPPVAIVPSTANLVSTFQPAAVQAAVAADEQRSLHSNYSSSGRGSVTPVRNAALRPSGRLSTNV